MPNIKNFHSFLIIIQFSPTGSSPAQLGWVRMGLMSQKSTLLPSLTTWVRKINTTGNCYCHRLLHPWGGRGGGLYPIKNQTKGTGILKIILSDFIMIIVIVIICLFKFFHNMSNLILKVSLSLLG